MPFRRNEEANIVSLGPDKCLKDREGEVWTIGHRTYFDQKGKVTIAKKIWLTPNICKRTQDLQEVV